MNVSLCLQTLGCDPEGDFEDWGEIESTLKSKGIPINDEDGGKGVFGFPNL